MRASDSELAMQDTKMWNERVVSSERKMRAGVKKKTNELAAEIIYIQNIQAPSLGPHQ
jgi:hypothetical protein